ncbi:MAG TPA: helix-turn-helix domain-containing protein [Solirubrobacteraceae bacterium]|nr:helix-turn-helix domain-containing protein [Solirubrobacteraceae bacterium]
MGSLDASLTVLIDAVRPLLEETADRAVARMVAEARSYRDHTADELRPVVLGNLEGGLDAVAHREPATLEQIELFGDAGRTRALQGVSVDDMLHGWRIGLDELRATARQQAGHRGLGDSVLLAFTDRCLAWADQGMLESTAEHRRTELDLARREQHLRANLVRQILIGTPSAGELRMQALAFGLDLAELYVPFRVSVPSGLDVRAAERQLGVADSAGPRRGLAALIDGDLAGFSCRLPGAAAGFVAGLGPAATLDALAHPYVLASRALDAALTLGLSGLIDFEQLGLLPAALSDDDVARPLEDTILGPLRRSGAAGQVILETVRRYLVNDRRLNETAAEMHTHVNTIRNRLARFGELTGRDLRRTPDLVETWWVLQRPPRQDS